MKRALIAVLGAGAFVSCATEKPEQARLPAFSLDAAGGGRLSVGYEKGVLVARDADGTSRPAAVLIHFFQPDCNACLDEMNALDALHAGYSDGGRAAVLGIAHRGDPGAVEALAGDLDYPLLLGHGSAVARALARGDATVIADRQGIVRYSQVGFQKGDAEIWRRNLDHLLAGEPVATAASGRATLAAGESFPDVRLPSLRSGEPMALVVEGGRLTFIGESGKKTHPEAAIGFFSRYWDFSLEEMGHLQTFHEKHAAEGLLVFAINMLDDAGEARRFTEDRGWTYPVFNGVGSALGQRYAYGWPAYIVDAGGVIRHTQIGFETGDEAKYSEVIEGLLGR